MPRGRRRIPDEIVALKGERRHHRQPERVAVPAGLFQPILDTAPIPEFVDRPQERAAFRTTIEDYLQRGVARVGDLTAYGRWAVYVQLFAEVKQKIVAESAHLETQRRSPLVRTLKDIEEMLRALEDRLGLNPMARQQIIRTLTVVPAPTRLADDAKSDDEPVSPLGFLSRR
jgi:hypothetical protein